MGTLTNHAASIAGARFWPSLSSGWSWFNSATFKNGWNVIGGSKFHAISRAASTALWAFMGLESAAVSAGVIENPNRNIPFATRFGLAISVVVYRLSCTVIMGIIPNEQLRSSHAPFAQAAQMVVGTTGMVVIGVCEILKSLGALGGWMLLVGQSAKAAADDGMFPRIFGRTNRYGVPGLGLGIVSVLMTIALFATVSPTIAGQFDRIINLTIILVVVPYVYASIAIKVIHDRRRAGPDFYHFQVCCGGRSRLLPLDGSGRRSQNRGRCLGCALSVPLLHEIDGERGETQRGIASGCIRGILHS